MKNARGALALATFAAGLGAAASFTTSARALPLSEEPGRLLYQTYVRAFFDGSAVPDQEGDFAGLAAKVDYLEDLGVGAVLLMPIFASTGDMGYIPRDYERLDTAYGDEAALSALIATLHARDIKVVLDAPFNHISYDSQWFVRGSQKRCLAGDPAYDPADPDHQFCDFFYFAANPCGEEPYRFWHKPWKWSTTDCNAVWFPRPDFDARYHRTDKVYATFFSVMPDLKFYDFADRRWNEPVVAAVERALTKWAALGVDGFRIDAAKHFVEGERRNDDPQEPRNQELLARFLAAARRVNPDVSFLGEIWAEHAEFEPYMTRVPQALDQSLDFPFMSAVRGSVASNYGEELKRVLTHFAARQDVIKPGQRVVFSGNHDVTRLMSEWGDDVAKWRHAHFLTMLTPASPLIYYGEELGMHGKVKRPTDTDPSEWVRTINAFPWHGRDESVGFPGGRRPKADLSDNYRERNLETAEADGGANSAVHLIRALSRVRKEFGVTNATRLVVRNDLYGHVIGWTLVNTDRAGRGKCLTVLTNFGAAATYTVPSQHADETCGTGLRELFVENAQRVAGEATTSYALAPYAKVVLGN